MPPNTTAAIIRRRLIILFLAIIWLGVASLSSATVHFGILVRERAKSDLVAPSDSILNITFQNLMGHVVVSMVIAALVSALFSVFGFVLVTYPKWLQENCTARFYYGCIHILVSLVVLSLGGYVASHVHGFQTSFEFFDREGHFPYYKIMYYGAVGQAAFGSLVVIMSLMRFFMADLRGHWKRTSTEPTSG
ncbi:hypothetical protein PENNAL_c0948G08083 [Penicillium nalgiovense]|uniref:MARVEL domain-containing protein n=1 Tax=Penicillium nalgiovense TaxID=60175 RepID=A0A1V6TUX1_PENNA|nr:hypothetical protein PENNAL_c0948G08083 [Penicillium nalgiovense]